MRFEAPILDAVAHLHAALRDRDDRLAVAESCTGGLLGGAITAVAGSSDVFDLGVVSYADAAKVELLGVPEATIRHTGAVSGPTARSMAVGVRDRLPGCDWGLSVTGLAGPGGGRPGKPVGTVYIGVAGRGDTGSMARRYRFDGDRDAIRHQTIRSAIELAIVTIAHSPDRSNRPP